MSNIHYFQRYSTPENTVTNKTVQTIWEIDSIVDVAYDKKTGQMEKKCIQGKDSKDYDDNLVAVIKDAKNICGYDIEYGCRFFCGKPVETEYRKTSPGGMRGAQFVNLREVIEDFDDAFDVARKLKNKEWE